jgi:flagellar biosynthesis protein FliR
LALFLTMAVLPGVSAGRSPDGEVAFVTALVTEFLLGTALGMAASAAYDGAYAGGRAIDDYVGVKAIAPSVQIVAPSGFGRIWSIAFTGGFFLLGVYRPTVAAFASSFVRVPVATPFESDTWLPFVTHVAETIVVVGAGVAAPAIGLALVVHVALGTLSRAVPRFGSVTLGFPLAFAAALIAVAVALAAR